jgi:DNA-binding winged helix-turn-helix (wHTH) protein
MQVIGRDSLIAETWPSGTHDPQTALSTAIKLLRRKLVRVGLRVHVVARRGYLLEVPSG